MPVVLTRRAVVRQSLLGDLAVRNDRLNLVARFEPGRPPIDVDDAAAKPVFRRNPVTDPVGPLDAQCDTCKDVGRSEEHTSELQSLMRISYAVFCLKKKTTQHVCYTYTNTQ